MIDFINENLGLILSIVIAILAVGITLYRVNKMTIEEKQVILLQALLQMVIEAEGAISESGKGNEKLSMVYDMFKKQFPFISFILSYKQFNTLVDEALERMEVILKNKIIEVDKDGHVTNLPDLLLEEVK